MNISCLFIKATPDVGHKGSCTTDRYYECMKLGVRGVESRASDGIPWFQ